MARQISDKTFNALWNFLVASKEEYRELQGSNSLDIPVEFMALHEAAENDFTDDSKLWQAGVVPQVAVPDPGAEKERQ